MKADPAHQNRLLDLQDIDIALDRLRHRARSLPELAEVEQLEGRISELSNAVAATGAELSDLDREQRKAESDVDQVRQREDRDKKRLDAGQVSSPKELEGLQSEIASLQRRREELEDGVLEIMERREAAEARRAETAGELEAAEAERAAAEERRKSALAEIASEERSVGDRRTVIVGEVPDDLLALYDKLRGSYDGIGAAALRHGRCEGCKLALSTSEVSEIRHAAPEEVLRCEQCRRILVRTSESGL